MNQSERVGIQNDGRSEALSFVGKIARRYRSDGLSGVIWVALKRLTGRWPLLFYYTFTAPVTALLPTSTNRQFRFVISTEVPSEKHLVQLDRTRALFNRRLSQGHWYVIAFDGENAVGLLWGHDGTIHFEQQYGFNVPFSENQVFYYDSLTLPEWRRQGVLQGMLGALAEHADQQNGKDELTAIIETSNLDSRRAHEKLGFNKRRLNLYCGALSSKQTYVIRRYT